MMYVVCSLRVRLPNAHLCRLIECLPTFQFQDVLTCPCHIVLFFLTSFPSYLSTGKGGSANDVGMLGSIFALIIGKGVKHKLSSY